MKSHTLVGRVAVLLLLISILITAAAILSPFIVFAWCVETRSCPGFVG